MEKLRADKFKDEIKQGYNCVTFSKEKCVTCEALFQVMKSVKHTHPDIRFWDFDKHQKMGEEIVEDYAVSYLPRSIFFKDGRQVGRILWMNIPIKDYEKRLTESIDELLKNGYILPTEEDAERVTQLWCETQDILTGMGWSFKGKQAVNSAIRKMWITDKIVESEPKWGILKPEELKELVKRVSLEIEDTPIEKVKEILGIEVEEKNGGKYLVRK